MDFRDFKGDTPDEKTLTVGNTLALVAHYLPILERG
jgi:hypothetical protein